MISIIAFPFRLIFSLFIFLSFLLSIANADEVIKTDIGQKIPDDYISSKYSFGMLVSYRSIQGQFDQVGNYSSTADGTSVNTISTVFSEGYRFTPNWEQTAVIPLNHSATITPTGASDLFTLSSPTIDIKYHFHQYFHLTTLVGGSLPVRTHWGTKNGDPAAAASLENDLGSVGGRGPDIHTGFSVWETYKKFKGSFQGSVAFPFAQTNSQSDVMNGPPVTVKRGTTFQMGEGLSYLYDRHWNLNLGLKQSWALTSIVDGEPSDGTASRLFTTSVGVSYGIDERLRCSAGYDTPWPFYAYIANQPYAPSISAGVSYVGL